MDTLNERLKVLERRLRQMQVALLSAFILLIFVITAGFSWARSGETTKQGSVLRVRGLIIEDDEGRPRILIGAPAPTIAARKRPESIDGIVLLGANGADRIVISYPGLEPQVMGKVEKRSIAVPSAGLVVNDSEGNERAGFGVSDDGTRISLGLDYADRDAMGLLVSPGFSGLAIFARNGERSDQVTVGVLKDGTSMAKLADSNGDEHILAEARKDAPVKLMLQNPTTHKLQDVSGKLVP